MQNDWIFFKRIVEPDLSRENTLKIKIHKYEIVKGEQTKSFSIIRGKGVRLQEWESQQLPSFSF
jgi:hypothetical protein